MNRLLTLTAPLLRPTDEEVPSEKKAQIQLHRLLTLLGAAILPGFGVLYAVYNPLAVDPIWARLALTGLFAALLVASYRIEYIRRNYVGWLRKLLYVLTAWTILLAYLNHFAGDYVAGLLLVYAALIVVVGIGAQRIRPVLRFAAFGLVGTALTASLTLAPHTSPLVLLAGMTTVAAVEGIAVHAYLSNRERVRSRAEWLQDLTNTVPGVVFQFVVGPDGTCQKNFVSKRAEEILGIPANTTDFYERFFAHVPGSHRRKIGKAIRRAAENQRPWRFEMPYERPDGERLWLLGSSNPQPRGDKLVLNGILFDITDQKDAKQAVQDREQKTEALYTATEQLLSCDSAREVAVQLEEILRSTFDYPLNGVRFVRQGRLVPAAVTPDLPEATTKLAAVDLDGESIAARVYRSGESVISDDLREVREFQYDRPLSGACVPIGRHGVVSIVSASIGGINSFDVRLAEILAAYAAAILDRIKREENLRTAREKTEEANHLKTAMLANMSHEIRTPLTAILGFGNLLADRLGGEEARFCEQIHRSGRRLMNTLDSVLQLSKLEAGTHDLEREQVDLAALVEEITNLLGARAENQNISLNRTLPNSSLEGCWSEGALRRIVENLLENAIKFTPEGGTVEARVKRGDRAAVFEVEDTGVGISTEVLPDVFDAFKQESEGLSRQYEGSGLGLSIVKELVQAHNGTIEVESQKGEGTRVTVRLPRSRTNRSEKKT